MNSYIDNNMAQDYSEMFASLDSRYDLEHEKRMIMYRILSEVERVADQKKLNRKELASLIGTSASYITQLFRGTKFINIETIAKFQKALDITFEISACSNESEEVIDNLNLDQIYENQGNIQGFWTFHSFPPSYNQKEKQVVPQESEFRRTA